MQPSNHMYLILRRFPYGCIFKFSTNNIVANIKPSIFVKCMKPSEIEDVSFDAISLDSTK
jgi:hypothetical protein